jgi:GntR family transcriptional regulator
LPAIYTVDPRSGVPLYLQLIEQIKRGVALGTLAPGEQLPTVKSLALSLTINPNTVARVYRELEHDGVIETSPGRGSFIRANGSVADARASLGELARDAFEAAVRDAKALGLAHDDVRDLAARAIARWYPPEENV